ncbi:TonB-dependent receptor [Aquabacterium sp.]|uniref:TonB-dependent receptor n=1 Tax=Aquabacterium sp. TaxID=1872578 RepID=UPI0035B10CEC
MKRKSSWAPALVVGVGLSAGGAHAEVVADTAQLDQIVVRGNYNNAIGTSDAASAGVVTSKLIEARPTFRPAEVLEFVPGVIVSQHSGDGKANQYYLRGFNLDHGTDFATSIDGMPANMPTHAHGQGYTDLNWLIPELIDRISYRKGPYSAEDGDFASAGSARIKLFDTLKRGVASLTVGENGYERGLLANSSALQTGKLLYALELSHNDGPWQHPEGFRKANGVLRYSLGLGDTKAALTAMAYSASWHSTDQVPLAAVQSGLIDRFGAVDPTDHGETQRYSLSLDLTRAMADGVAKLNAYYVQSKLDLYSNFTYWLADTTHGDQFEQAEQRRVFGLAASRAWDTPIAGVEGSTTIGLQARQDRLNPVGLYTAEGGARLSTVQQSEVHETAAALYAENATHWLPWLRTVAGLRTDHYDFDVTSSIAANSGQKTANINSPKLSVVLGPWRQTETFFNYGYGFHSNDARGVLTHVSPREGTPTDPSPALVRTKGAEVGVRGEWLPGLQTSMSLWRLTLGSELVFSGDAGDTEASGSSKRWGFELNNHYMLSPQWLIDADWAVSQARFNEAQGDAPNEGRFVPGSVKSVASVGVTGNDLGPWFGQFQLRYFGPRPLIEDGSVRSKATLLAYGRVGYKLTPDLKLSLDVFNLFDRQASDIDYYYESRLTPSAASESGLHFHPVEPRTFRVTLTANF